MIRGELVDLRAIERSDAETVAVWLNEPAVMRGWGDSAPAASLAAVQNQIEGWLHEETTLGRPAALMIATPERAAVGLIVIRRERPEARTGELSLLIGDPERWGEGIGTDALQTMIDACFGGWHLHRLWLRSEAWNVRAHRLYLRCGFLQEGVLREAAFLDGRHEDVICFGMLFSDWIAANE